MVAAQQWMHEGTPLPNYTNGRDSCIAEWRNSPFSEFFFEWRRSTYMLRLGFRRDGAL
jgi:hypothetical protein